MSMTPELVKKRKEELIDKYQKDINEKNLTVVGKMESELINLAKEEIKDNPSTQIYDCGGRGNYSNNYKNTVIMRGAIKSLDGDPDRVTISTSSLADGIKPEELAAYGDILTQGYYSKAIQTREGGYESKKLSASFQSTFLGEPGSDCHSKRYLKIELTEKNYNLFLYRYILDNNSLVMLDNDNKDKYVGKIVDMRTALFCKDDNICSKCAGELYYKLGIRNVGLLTNGIAGVLLNLSMKSFHNSTIKTKELNILDFIMAE
jgi:hypothetical protein